MRRVLCLWIGVIFSAVLVLFGSPALAQQSGKVLLIIRDAKPAEPQFLDVAITKEAGVMKAMLEKAGYGVEIASPTGEPWGTPTESLKPDLKLSDVKVADYKGFIIPCLAIESTALHPDLAAVIKKAVEQGKPVAAQLGGVTMLAKAGVLSGKKYAISGEIAMEFKDGIYSGSGVVKDGKIITSGICPAAASVFKGMQDGTARLTEALIAEL